MEDIDRKDKYLNVHFHKKMTQKDYYGKVVEDFIKTKPIKSENYKIRDRLQKQIKRQEMIDQEKEHERLMDIEQFKLSTRQNFLQCQINQANDTKTSSSNVKLMKLQENDFGEEKQYNPQNKLLKYKLSGSKSSQSLIKTGQRMSYLQNDDGTSNVIINALSRVCGNSQANIAKLEKFIKEPSPIKEQRNSLQFRMKAKSISRHKYKPSLVISDTFNNNLDLSELKNILAGSVIRSPKFSNSMIRFRDSSQDWSQSKTSSTGNAFYNRREKWRNLLENSQKSSPKQSRMLFVSHKAKASDGIDFSCPIAQREVLDMITAVDVLLPSQMKMVQNLVKTQNSIARFIKKK